MRVPPSLTAGFPLSLLIASPISAVPLTLSTSGPGLVPCGDQMCMHVDWVVEGDAPGPAGQITLALPTPDPEVWELASGFFLANGTASFGGRFDSSEVEQATGPPGDTSVGSSSPEYLVLDASGDTLTRNDTILYSRCAFDGEPTTFCSDGNGMDGSPNYYSVVPGDDAFLGPLTLTYDFDPQWEIVPLSEYYRVELWIGADAVYNRIVPQPGTGLLVIAGLLGLAGWRRMSA